MAGFDYLALRAVQGYRNSNVIHKSRIIIMKKLLLPATITFATIWLTACGSSRSVVETTATLEWEYSLRYYNQNDPGWTNQVFMSDDGNAISVINARGLATFNMQSGELMNEVSAQWQSAPLHSTIGFGYVFGVVFKSTIVVL
jgi:hypothetical protein